MNKRVSFNNTLTLESLLNHFWGNLSVKLTSSVQLDIKAKGSCSA